MRLLSASRLAAIMAKEFIQMRRDRLTFAMMVGIPIMQLLLFGFAINSDPRNLPTAVVVADNSVFARTYVKALQNSGYFRLVADNVSEAEAARLIKTGRVQFAVHIPEDFSRSLQRGERPAVLVVADASDPAATSNAIGALQELGARALDADLTGPLAGLRSTPAPIDLIIHRRYNPEGITQYNIVPGLMGVVLTMTMVIMTGLAVTRERERGTMESLLAMPVQPLEVMIGKIAPYIAVGYVQVVLILAAAVALFNVPAEGSIALLLAISALFIAANLAVGYTFSTVAKNQLQAMQMSFFFFLPSLLLSGFMFPFRGMPEWAQWIGEVLPLTHFLRIVRGILLKGNGWAEVSGEVWALLAFMLAAMSVALLRYRRTLD